jgi:hypothetical protein
MNSRGIPNSPEMGREPVVTTMRGEMIFNSLRIPMMQPHLGHPFDESFVYAVVITSLLVKIVQGTRFELADLYRTRL